MAVVETLRSVVEAYPQTRLVAYADLASRMVLCSAGSEDLTQEHLDQLCREAQTSFSEPLSTLADMAFGRAYGSMVIDGAAVKLFLRSEAESDDVLCCICDHGIDLGAFVARLRETLDEISMAS